MTAQALRGSLGKGHRLQDEDVVRDGAAGAAIATTTAASSAASREVRSRAVAEGGREESEGQCRGEVRSRAVAEGGGRSRRVRAGGGLESEGHPRGRGVVRGERAAYLGVCTLLGRVPIMALALSLRE